MPSSDDYKKFLNDNENEHKEWLRFCRNYKRARDTYGRFGPIKSQIDNMDKLDRLPFLKKIESIFIKIHDELDILKMPRLLQFAKELDSYVDIVYLAGECDFEKQFENGDLVREYNDLTDGIKNLIELYESIDIAHSDKIMSNSNELSNQDNYRRIIDKLNELRNDKIDDDDLSKLLQIILIMIESHIIRYDEGLDIFEIKTSSGQYQVIQLWREFIKGSGILEKHFGNLFYYNGEAFSIFDTSKNYSKQKKIESNQLSSEIITKLSPYKLSK